ncbi:glycoside hydrolase superfamily [Neocallimastix lanati (nom. inval.)]|nr:glycoside hydrolase superfamily [Neocallimastix sp. JGI-2020a]
MKFIPIFILIYFCIFHTNAMRDIPSKELVKYINIGWNLGNTLDAQCIDYLNYSQDQTASETCWGNVKTKPELFQKLYSLGFNIFRIPTTWSGHFGDGPDYLINENWMKRVREVVEYALNTGGFAILNIHHETWNHAFSNNLANAKVILQAIWKQIAEEFIDFDEHLIFEGLNEPRKVGTEVEWTGGDEEGWNFINEMNNLFITTVRQTGGNNALRHLMIPTYAASVSELVIQNLKFPTEDHKIIISLHAYTPYRFALDMSEKSLSEFNDGSEIDYVMNVINSTLIDQGIPAIIGEFGAVIRNDNEEERAKWGKYYTEKAREIGVPCILWDNGIFEGNGERFGFIHRPSLNVVFPKLLDGLMCGLGNSTYCNSLYGITEEPNDNNNNNNNNDNDNNQEENTNNNDNNNQEEENTNNNDNNNQEEENTNNNDNNNQEEENTNNNDNNNQEEENTNTNNNNNNQEEENNNNNNNNTQNNENNNNNKNTTQEEENTNTYDDDKNNYKTIDDSTKNNESEENKNPENNNSSNSNSGQNDKENDTNTNTTDKTDKTDKTDDTSSAIHNLLFIRVLSMSYQSVTIDRRIDFRGKIGGVSLFITIREIYQRRKNDNKETYLAFLDLKKAYDSVPIDALGIRGKRLLKNLYLTSKASELDKVVHYHQFFSIYFINDIFNDFSELGIPLGESRCCGGLFADDIVLCAPSRTKLQKKKKMLKKCATMVIRPDTPPFQNKRDPTIHLAGQPIPITKCYTYYSKFLSNSKIPIPFKKIIINSYVLSKVSYFTPSLGSNKVRTNSTQKLINKGLRWIAGLQKNLNIPPLSARCALSQIQNCIISYLVNNIPKSRKYTWTKESRTLKRKLERKERARSGYRLDARIAKAAKIIDQMCPNFCPCCKNNNDYSNSNNSNSNNSYSNSSYSIFSNVSNSIENNVYVDSSVYEKMFNFLLGGQSINNSAKRSINNSTREWKDLFKCQMKSGAYSDTPFLVVTASTSSIDYTYCSNRNRTTTTKSVNAEETVRQASRA